MECDGSRRILVYGAAGSIVIVLLWVDYCSQVVLFGAEFRRVCAAQRGSPLKPKEIAVRRTRQGLA
jgi:membrane protein